MSSKRYGILVKPFGYVYDGPSWGKLRFTPDATKAAFGKSYTKEEEAIEFIERIQGRKEFEDVQLAVYELKATATLREVGNAKAAVMAQRKIDYATEVKEYLETKAQFDALTEKELEAVSENKWSRFKASERKLLILELI